MSINIEKRSFPNASLQLQAAFSGWESVWAFLSTGSTSTDQLNHLPLGITSQEGSVDIWTCRVQGWQMWCRTHFTLFCGMWIRKTCSLTTSWKASEGAESCHGVRKCCWHWLLRAEESTLLRGDWHHGISRRERRFLIAPYKLQLLGEAGHCSAFSTHCSSPSVHLGFSNYCTLWNTEKCMLRVNPALKPPSSRLPRQSYPFGFQQGKADGGVVMVMGWRAGLVLPTMSKTDQIWEEVSVRLLLPWSSDRREVPKTGSLLKASFITNAECFYLLFLMMLVVQMCLQWELPGPHSSSWTSWRRLALWVSSQGCGHRH